MEKHEEQLLSSIEDLANFLGRYESKWSKHFRHYHKLLSREFSKAHLGKLQGTFHTTMGGFTDLIICRSNRHSLKPEEERSVNEELKRLGHVVYLDIEACLK